MLFSAANSASCTEGDVRLRDGANDREGRVEVCVGGVWGTVCEASWDNLDAQVVCKQLRFSDTGTSNLHSAIDRYMCVMYVCVSLCVYIVDAVLKLFCIYIYSDLCTLYFRDTT